LAVALIAWFLRGAIARAALNAVQDKLADLDALKDEHARTVAELREVSERRAAAEAIASRVPGLEAAVAERTHELGVRDAKLAETSTRAIEERKAAAEKLALLNNAQRQLADALKALSSDASLTNTQTFIELATMTLEKFQEGAKADLAARQQAIDELVKPLKESLEKVDDKLGEIEKARIAAYVELSTQVKGLVETHLPALRHEAATLSRALRQPHVRGRWGEIQLKRVVEIAGMV